MVETTVSEVVVESPNINVNLPSGGNFSFVNSIRDWLDSIVAKLREGSDEAVFGIMLTAMLVVTGVYIWRAI